MDINCLISKEIYQFLPGACVKMRAIFKSSCLKIAVHGSDVIMFFGALSSSPSTE